MNTACPAVTFRDPSRLQFGHGLGAVVTRRATSSPGSDGQLCFNSATVLEPWMNDDAGRSRTRWPCRFNSATVLEPWMNRSEPTLVLNRGGVGASIRPRSLSAVDNWVENPTPTAGHIASIRPRSLSAVDNPVRFGLLVSASVLQFGHGRYQPWITSRSAVSRAEWMLQFGHGRYQPWITSRVRPLAAAVRSELQFGHGLYQRGNSTVGRFCKVHLRGFNSATVFISVVTSRMVEDFRLRRASIRPRSLSAW